MKWKLTLEGLFHPFARMKSLFLVLALALLVACSGQKGKGTATENNATEKNASEQNATDSNATDPIPSPPTKDGNATDSNGTDSNETAVTPAEDQAPTKSDSNMLMIIVLLLLLVSNFFLWRLYSDFERWKERSADGKHFIVIPDRVQDYVEQSEGAMLALGDKMVEFREALAATATRMVGRADEQKKALDKSVAEFEEHLEAVKGLADERKKEIDRYKQGYDIVAKKALVLDIIESIDIFDDFICELGAAESTDSNALECLETLREKLLIILENDNIDQLRVEAGVGIDAEAVRGKVKIVSSIEATDPTQVGTIASVKTPCYFTYVTEEETVTIRPALVVVYREPPKDEAEPEKTEPETKEENES